MLPDLGRSGNPEYYFWEKLGVKVTEVKTREITVQSVRQKKVNSDHFSGGKFEQTKYLGVESIIIDISKAGLASIIEDKTICF